MVDYHCLVPDVMVACLVYPGLDKGSATADLTVKRGRSWTSRCKGREVLITLHALPARVAICG